jgi:2-polyprenyl-3-methyl-5-hydroxy-6-metoxy-1,4-benzoquinol methylase
MNKDKSKDQLREEWNGRAKRPGELAVLSLRYPTDEIEVGSRQYVDAMMSFIGNDLKGKDVIEIGSGIGRFTERLVEAAAKVTCVDPSAEMIKRNKARLGERSKQVTYLEMFVDEYSPISLHDVAICSLVLNHIPEELFPKAVNVISGCAKTIFLSEQTQLSPGNSEFTFIRSAAELISAFESYQVEKQKMYQHFCDEVTFLKLSRINR